MKLLADSGEDPWFGENTQVGRVSEVHGLGVIKGPGDDSLISHPALEEIAPSL